MTLPWSHTHSHHPQAGSSGGKGSALRHPLLGKVSASNIPQISFLWPSNSHSGNTEKQ